MHWPHAHTESGMFIISRCPVRDDRLRFSCDVSTGEFLPYGKKPTFIDTWMDMEKLLETGAKALSSNEIAAIT